jgi:hypothetical protein
MAKKGTFDDLLDYPDTVVAEAEWSRRQKVNAADMAKATAAQSDRFRQVDQARKVSASAYGPRDDALRYGQSPTLASQGGFANPRAPQIIDRTLAGANRVDEIADPGVRGALHKSLLADPQAMASYRANIRAEAENQNRARLASRPRADPAVMAQAQASLGPPADVERSFVEQMSPAQRAKFEARKAERMAKSANSDRIVTAKAMRRKAERDARLGKPQEEIVRNLDESIGRFNDRQSGLATNPANERLGVGSGSFMERSDFVRAMPMAPVGMGELNDPRAAAGIAGPSGQVFRTQSGMFRRQKVDGQDMMVPVTQGMDGASVIDAASVPDIETFRKLYGDDESPYVASRIRSGGNDEWSRRQRQLDSARFELTKDEFTAQERAQADQEIRSQEQSLHYAWLRSMGQRPTSGGVRSLRDFMAESQMPPTTGQAYDIYREIAPGFSDPAQAWQEAVRLAGQWELPAEAGSSPPPVVPKTGRTSGDKPATQEELLKRTQSIYDDMVRAWPGYVPPTEDQLKSVYQQARGQALRELEGRGKPLDVGDSPEVVQRFDEELRKVADLAAEGKDIRRAAERIADRFPGNVSSADEVEAFIRDLTESKQ